MRNENPAGCAKISKFCNVTATHHGVRFGWMDTVCINKDSSSELDESIRSMYKWYRGAHVCVAYLAETCKVESINRDSWFRRGWTLQELLAPMDIKFYDMDWEVLGEEGDPRSAFVTTIETEITQATRITAAELALCRRGAMDKLPISRIFEMAARREVTRAEDSIYSLMGLLGVDIPTAYGEGAKRALFRLLRELLGTRKHILDMFNYGIWRTPNSTLIPSTIKSYNKRTSIFDSSDGQTASLLDWWQPSEPIILTHLGVRLPLLLVPGLIQPRYRTHIEDFVPKGLLFGDMTADIKIMGNNAMEGYITCNFNMLDARIYNAGSDSNPSSSRYIHNGSIPSVLTFGVVNFGMDNGSILLPQNCLSIALDCGTMKPGEVYPSDSIKIQPVLRPPVFQLKSNGENPEKIPKDDLEKHGMQMVTLYL